jgi:hypothetical protein
MGSGIGSPRVVQQVALRAGNGLADALTRLGAAQAAREAARAHARSAGTATTVEALSKVLDFATLRDGIASETTRLSLVAPTTGKAIAGVYGQIQQAGVGVGGGTVELLAGTETVARVAADAQGRFALTASTKVPLVLRYRAEDGTIWTDPSPLVAPDQPASYRVLDLASLNTTTAAAATAPAPAPGPAIETLPGMHFDAALAQVAASGTSVGKVTVTSGADQSVKVASADTHSDGTVAVAVTAPPGAAGTLAVLAGMLAHDPAGAAFGLADAAAATAWLAQHAITDLAAARAFVERSPAALAETLSLAEPAAVQTLRNLIVRTLGRIVVGG